MNTYPKEYVQHHVPVMAVYGLSEPKVDADLAKNDTQQSSTPDADPVPVRRRSSTSSNHLRLRATIVHNLRALLTSRENITLWDAAKHTPASGGSYTSGIPNFRVKFVENDFSLPPKKPNSYQQPSMHPHSALSPLSNQSPLHPDGLMTPQWYEKHFNIYPSTVVGFYDLWDWSMEPGSPPRPKKEVGPLAGHSLADPVEKERDAAMAHGINERRKYFQERGLKFAVVVILNPRHADDPAIEDRLSLLRKLSGLESKNSLFVLPISTSTDATDFLNNLFKSLFESAQVYYNNQVKRVRKKLSRLPSPSVAMRQVTPQNIKEPQPLSVPGWICRYEYKIGVFQEFGQDIQGSLKSYDVSYNMLLNMLQPNSGDGSMKFGTRRWKEAWTLADCMNIKICRAYLFQDNSQMALTQLNKHLHALQLFCNEWHIGERTFEYWAWLSKQYRIFAEQIDVATRHGFKPPVPLPSQGQSTSPPLNSSPFLGSGGHSSQADGGINPGELLQHAGFYYHLAAMCSAERRRRYIEIEKMKTSESKTEDPTYLIAMKTLEEEEMIDHSALTIELLTKGYEQFKKHRNSRMTLYLAAEIAGTYYEAGKFDMALKFFERIGKTYRKEHWHTVLTSILRWSLRCAKELNMTTSAIGYLIELLCDDLPMSEEKRIELQNDLEATLMEEATDEMGKSEEPLAISMDDINSFLKCNIQFEKKSSYVNESIKFQVAIIANKQSPPEAIEFQSLRVTFNNGKWNQIYLHDQGGNDKDDKYQYYDCSDSKYNEETNVWEANTNLQFRNSQTKIFEGMINADHTENLKLESVILEMKSLSRPVYLTFNVANRVQDARSAGRRKWYQPDSPKPAFIDGRGELSSIEPSRLAISTKHQSPALVDEHYPFSIILENQEATAVEAIIRVEIKTPENQDLGDKVKLKATDDDTDAFGVLDINVGQIDANSSKEQPMFIIGRAIPMTRLLNISVRYKASSSSNQEAYFEKQETAKINYHKPFEIKFQTYEQTKDCSKVAGFPPELKEMERLLVIAAIRCTSPWNLHVDSIEIEQNEQPSHANLHVRAMPKAQEDDKKVWKKDQVVNSNHLFELTVEDRTAPRSSVDFGALKITWRRVGDGYEQTPLCQTSIPFPPLSFSPSEIRVHRAHFAELQAQVEVSEAFVFSGYKQTKFRVLPFSSQKLRYHCHPILAGNVRLPKLKVDVTNSGEVSGTTDAVVYVKPRRQ
ncbi:hypothetical protein NQZ79_g1227 [Umbelopsis isabellina]|nr:hypothetical protein NQZ79_g1227 [Umbelopsis isabellina]